MNGKLLTFRQAADAGGALSSEALVAACGAGDRAALGALFERFNVSVYRFLSRYLGAGCQDLDDLVQATFLEIMRSAGRFRQDSSVQTWVFGIAVNIARHYRRSEGRRRVMTVEVGHHPRASGPSPEHDAAQAEQVARLAWALPQLSEDLRTAFVMCELEDQPGAEVARVLNWREGTLWRRLHEARKQLRKILEEEHHESHKLPSARRTLAGIFSGR
jgi:RNA polymerase sigma-70 factor (ECF subfamily)